MPRHPKSPDNQKKPINPRKRAIQNAQKRQSRGRIYLAIIVILTVAIGVGWYVYASGQTANQNMAPTGLVYAKLNTSKGLIEVELYNNSAPKTVTNFVNLAKSGFYNNLVWHRINAGFVIQTGDPTTRNGGGNRSTWGNGSSQQIPFEYDPTLHNNIGYLGMASTGTAVGGSCQFYVNLADNGPSLDGKYAVFGKVITGMDAVNALANLPTTTQYTSSQAPEPVNPADAMLLSVTISTGP